MELSLRSLVAPALVVAVLFSGCLDGFGGTRADASGLLSDLTNLSVICRAQADAPVDASTGRVLDLCNTATATGPRPVNEPSIAVNPKDPLNLIAGANDYNVVIRGPAGPSLGSDVWAGVYVSKDGGATWKEGFLPGYPGGPRSALTGFNGAGDAAIAFAPDGTAYYAGIAFKRSATTVSNRVVGTGTVYLSEPPALFIARSTDGGETWDHIALPHRGVGSNSYVAIGPAAVFASASLFQDKEYIAVGPDGTVYVTWTAYEWVADPTGGYVERSGYPYFTAPIKLIKSSDRGMTWSSPVTLSRTQDNQGSVPVVTADGTLAVTWAEYLDASTVNIVARTSSDRGATFTAPSILAKVNEIRPSHYTRVNSFPSIATDPGTSSTPGRLSVVWSANATGDADVYYAQSLDKGLTWSEPIRVNADPAGNGRAQFFPWVATDPQGAVSIVYYDGRDDPRNQQLAVYVATTSDGRTFVERAVTDAPFTADSDGFSGDNFLGDYLGIAAGESGVFPIWPDTRSARTSLGDLDLYTARLVHPVDA